MTNFKDSIKELLLETLTAEEAKVMKRLEDIREARAQLTGEHILPNYAQRANLSVYDNIKYPKGYSEKATWLNKVRFILRANGGKLTTTEIVEHLSKIEPKYIEQRKTAVASISATLSTASKEDGEFGKYTNEANENVYYIKSDALELAKKEFENDEPFDFEIKEH